jgi:hypothetical protein
MLQCYRKCQVIKKILLYDLISTKNELQEGY